MGSVAQDALVIGASALLASRLLREKLTLTDYNIVTAALLFLTLERYPLLGLGLVLWLPMWSEAGVTVLRRSVYSLVGFAVFIGWFVFNLGLQAVMRPGVPASSGPQIHYISEHLGEIPAILWNTVSVEAWQWCRGFVGQLGWLNVVLPENAYIVAMTTLAAAAVCCALDPLAARSRVDRAITALAGFGVLLMIIVASYLTWTFVGQDHVDGIQGRYLYSIAVLLPFLVPAVGARAKALPVNAIQLGCTLWVAVSLAFVLWHAQDQLERTYKRALKNQPAVLGP
jgi:uncharacterized membrane protein